MYWSSLWAKILNVQHLIGNCSLVKSRIFLPPPSPVLANIHSILACDVPRTQDVGLPTKFQFKAGPASQPIPGSMPVNRLRRWTNTNPSLGLLYTSRKHVTFTQCWFNVDPQSLMLARHWNSIGWLYRVFWLLHAGDYTGDASHPGIRNNK